MSTKVIRTIDDFLRFNKDIDVECYCGHTNTLDAVAVTMKFTRKRWYKILGPGVLRPGAESRFRCTKCGRRGAKQVGPIAR